MDYGSALAYLTDKIDSIEEEIKETEELLKDTDDEYSRNRIIQDTYEMIKQILEIEGSE